MKFVTLIYVTKMLRVNMTYFHIQSKMKILIYFKDYFLFLYDNFYSTLKNSTYTDTLDF